MSSKLQYQQFLNQTGHVIWMTGLSGSGKTTIAASISELLTANGFYNVVLDGDEMRKGLCRDLGYTVADRHENIRRVAEVAKVFVERAAIVICPLITPTEVDRALAKAIIGEQSFSLVYVETPLSVCESRDIKGMYKQARAGLISDFTGISAPFEIPQADITIQTSVNGPNQAASIIVNNLEKKINGK